MFLAPQGGWDLNCLRVLTSDNEVWDHESRRSQDAECLEDALGIETLAHGQLKRNEKRDRL